MKLFLVAVLIISTITVLVSFILTIVSFVMKRSVKRPAILLLIGLCVFGADVLGIVKSVEHEQAVEQAQIEAQEAQDAKDDKKFNSAYSKMMAGAYVSAASAETLANKINSTWHDAIFNDAGATVAGKQYTDFDTAIVKLVASETKLTKSISDGNDAMDDALSTMNEYVTDNTSSKLSKAKKIIKQTKKLNEMATSPSGSYRTYGDNFSEQDDTVSDLIG